MSNSTSTNKQVKPPMRRAPVRPTSAELTDRLAQVDEWTKQPIVKSLQSSDMGPPTGNNPPPATPAVKKSQTKAAKRAGEGTNPAVKSSEIPEPEKFEYPWDNIDPKAITNFSTRIPVRLQEKLRHVATLNFGIGAITEAALTPYVNALLAKRGIKVED